MKWHSIQENAWKVNDGNVYVCLYIILLIDVDNNKGECAFFVPLFAFSKIPLCITNVHNYSIHHILEKLAKGS